MKTDWTTQIRSGHHAYLIAGNYEKTLPELVSFLEKDWKIKIKGNPDFIVHHYPTLYIENFRDLEKETLTKPLEGSKRIFIISFGFMTREAANAMLKLFEEPIDQVVFFTITPNPERLPATLRSRFSEVKAPRPPRLHSGQEVRGSAYREAERFLKFNLGKRFEYSKKLAGDISGEKRTRADALAIMEALEEIIAEKYPVTQKTAPLFQEFEKCRSYLKDQAASVKLLFDSVALLVSELSLKSSDVK
jgi:hypothetical protein